jgi:tetratricopeptide (TPR) repeat protein
VASFDRNGTLRNAEKLLRQGKLEAAAAEYLRVVEDQPGDWNTANTLGDLYSRAGQTERAVEQFLKVADSLREEGQFVKAAALFKKILKLQPDNERALLQAAELVAGQGLYADARAYLNTVLEKRKAAGDARGAAMARVRLGSLDPTDYAARVEGAKARVDMGDSNGAVNELSTVASELAERARYDEAVEALRLAATIDAENEQIRSQLFDIYVSAENFAYAAECATAAAQFVSLADSLELRERHDEALDMLRRAAQLDTEDKELRARVAKAFLGRGDLQSAAEFLTAETAGDDPKLLMTVAEIQLRAGQIDPGMVIVRKLLADDASRREEIAMLGWNIAPHAPESGFAVVELSAEAAVAKNDWASAAAALQEFVTRCPSFIPALMRLVEICVDGGLEATMYSAQAQLADAYIATGSVAEARFIAEDLVAREPWERANIERFRRTLEMLGEPDPDGVIAERLSGQTPFTSTDLLVGVELPTPEPEPETDEDGLTAELRAMLEEAEGGRPAPKASKVQEPPADDVSFEEPVEDEVAVRRARKAAPPKKPKDEPEDSHFELSSNAIDLQSILGDLDSIDPDELEPERPAPPPKARGSKPKPKAHAEQESVEVDLSIDLDGIKPGGPVKAAAPSEEPDGEESYQENDIDSVFAQMRTKASRTSSGDGAEEQLKEGMSLREAGKIDASIRAFETAARSPRHRFQASVFLGRIYREKDQMKKAIEWFERATQAPAPSPDEGFMLLYELADSLEATGEVERALAVCMELQADAGDFRDVKARVSRLSKVAKG